jgi:hypothetical protein
MAAYDAAKQGAPKHVKGVSSGTWRWLCTRYFPNARIISVSIRELGTFAD